MSRLNFCMRTGMAWLLAMPLFAVPASADTTRAAILVCALTRSAECNKKGACKWAPASAADDRDRLLIDFKARKAFILRNGKRRRFGFVLEDKIAGGAPRFLVGALPNVKKPDLTMQFVATRDGRFEARSDGGRSRFEGTCKTPSSDG